VIRLDFDTMKGSRSRSWSGSLSESLCRSKSKSMSLWQACSTSRTSAQFFNAVAKALSL